MTFADIIGQEEVKQRLLHEVETGHLPHALLLAGPEGNGGFAIAWALASRLLNNSPLVGKMQHPDLSFSYPIYKKDSKKPAPCELFAKPNSILPRYDELACENLTPVFLPTPPSS